MSDVDPFAELRRDVENALADLPDCGHRVYGPCRGCSADIVLDVLRAKLGAITAEARADALKDALTWAHLIDPGLARELAKCVTRKADVVAQGDRGVG